MRPRLALARDPRLRSVALLLSVLPLMLGAAPPPKASPPKSAPPPADPGAAVLRVEVVVSPHDPDAPWKRMSPMNASASAFVIDHDRLLTNAHVVHEAQQITVKKNDGSAPALATVEAADEECDLAVLRVADKAFLASVPPLTLGDLPVTGSSVTIFGYPIGGVQLSRTAGIVSRIERIAYYAGDMGHLAVQTDAAMNPGNSGGPVVQGGAVVGVAFQGLSKGTSEGISYFIPTPIVRHFLDDLADGHYGGFPDVPLTWSSLESPALRAESGLPRDRTGVVLQAVFRGGSFDHALTPGDILLSIDGVVIGDDGTYASDGSRLNFLHLLDMKAVGDAIHFSVWRKGREEALETKAAHYPAVDRLRRSVEAPKYLVYGGLVFQPATYALVFAKMRLEARATVERAVQSQVYGLAPDLDREIVLLTQVIKDPVNDGDSEVLPVVVERVNGEPVASLAGLARTLDQSQRKRDVFELSYPQGTLIALDHDKVISGRAAFMSAHEIANDRNL